MRSVLAASVALVLALSCGLAEAQRPNKAKYAGRRLEDVLKELTRSGLRIVFSSEVVSRDARVASEPKAASPREALDEMLAPHGLEARQGPRATLLIVRRRRAAGPPAAALNGSIAGRIVDSRSGEPLAQVPVILREPARRAITGPDGAFRLEDVPEGRHTLYVSMVGYGLARPAVDVTAGERSELTVPLAPGTSTYVEQVTVSAESNAPRPADPPAQFTLTSADLQELRGVLADDPMRAAQAMPLAATGDDFRAEFSVRGSDFRHLGVSIDGVPTRWLVHSVRAREDTASIAMLNGTVLEGLTLSAGTYPQVHGSRTGAWLDATLRAGSRAALKVQGAVSGTNASLVAEGPIGGQSRGSWLVSARQSYLDWLVRRFDPNQESAFGFTDAQAKVVFDVTSRHQFELTALGGRSAANERDDAPSPNGIKTGQSRAHLVTAALRSTLGRAAVLTQRVAATQAGFHNVSEFDQELAHGLTREWMYRADLAIAPSARRLLETGVMIQHESEDVTLRQYSISSPSQAVPVSRRVDRYTGRQWLQSGYLRGTLALGEHWSVAPGVRMMRSTLLGETSASPWIVAGWQPDGDWLVRAGVGASRQQPGFEQVHFASFPEEIRSERARHADIGIERRIGPSSRWQMTLYSRDERDVLRLEGTEPRIVEGSLVPRLPLGYWRNALHGQARGFEVTFKRSAQAGLSGWLSYGFGRLRYRDALRGESFPGDFDQRHSLTAYGHYRLSPRTSASAVLRVGSNVPLAGYFEERNGALFAGERRNTVRLPVYARLDARAARTFNFTTRRLTLFVEVLNVLNRTNIGPADGVVRQSRVADGFVEELFSLLPSAGIRIEF